MMKKRPKRPIDTSVLDDVGEIEFDPAALSTSDSVIQFFRKHQLINEDSTDIRELIYTDPNLQLEFKDLGDNDAYIEKVDDEKFMIAVNIKHSTTRQNFSMAHEFAHYQLHRSKIEDMPHGEKILHRNENKDPIEYEANDFAAEILMPKDTFKQVVRVNTGDILKVAKAFQVSSLAVRYRAKSLGIKGHGL